VQPLVELHQQRSGPGLAVSPPNVRRLPAYVRLDGVQRLDAPQRLRGEAAVVAAVLDADPTKVGARAPSAASTTRPLS
jgi:hypothetical protein